MLKLAPNDVRLLLDENISPNLSPRLWDAGIDALPLRNRSMLRVSDYKVLAFADKDGRVIATIDEFDFEKLLVKRKTHNGVVAIPGGGTRDDQFNFIMAGMEYLRQAPSAMALARDSIITVNEQLRVSRRMVCSPSLAPTLAVVINKPA